MGYGEVSLKGDPQAAGLHARRHAIGQPGPLAPADPASVGWPARSAAGEGERVRTVRIDERMAHDKTNDRDGRCMVARFGCS